MIDPAMIDVLLIGCLATALADVGQQALKRGAGLPIANWGLIGRWVAGMARGRFVHATIADAPGVRHERAIGWTFHYAVGVAYAGLYAAALGALGAQPSLASALAFGAATLVAPWFVMQPALGAGVMARRTDHRWAVRVVTTATHLTFGAGLYVGGLAAAALRSLLSTPL